MWPLATILLFVFRTDLRLADLFSIEEIAWSFYILFTIFMCIISVIVEIILANAIAVYRGEPIFSYLKMKNDLFQTRIFSYVNSFVVFFPPIFAHLKILRILSKATVLVFVVSYFFL